MVRSAMQYVTAYVKLTGDEDHKDMIKELVELIQQDERQSDKLGQMMIEIDECLECSQLPDHYTQVNPFYVEMGYDDPYEAATRMQEQLESIRVEIAKLAGAQRSFKRIKQAMQATEEEV